MANSRFLTPRALDRCCKTVDFCIKKSTSRAWRKTQTQTQRVARFNDKTTVAAAPELLVPGDQRLLRRADDPRYNWSHHRLRFQSSTPVPHTYSMPDGSAYPKVAQLKTVAALRERLAELGISLPIDDRILSAAEGSPLAQPAEIAGRPVANRWCIHPMEGWDANRDGSPSAHTLRRWGNFGRSGAKLIWGGEAAAVRPDGRANPNQTMAVQSNRAGLAALLNELTSAHRESFGDLDGVFIGLQLTHSGRFCKPDDHFRSAPRIAYHHPLLDAKFKIDPNDNSIVWTDAELDALIDDYIGAARLAYEVGFHFVDVKACHGYLLHEFLSARHRPGRFGGDLAGRTRVLTTIIDRIRDELPTLAVGVRLSIFDSVPYQTSREIGR